MQACVVESEVFHDAGDKQDGGEEVSRGLFVAGGDRAELLDPGKEVLDQMARRIKLPIIVARGGPVGSRSRTRWSASNALSVIDVSAAIVGSRWSAPTSYTNCRGI
jgi:hypothetical protein